MKVGAGGTATEVSAEWKDGKNKRQLEDALAAGGWEGIDSAPTDGTAIWAKGGSGERPYQCWAVYRNDGWVCLNAEQFILNDLYEWLPRLS